ncbi:MAG: FHA domain-containing protein [Chloroflexi bacterium]|nr:FHA domain-containing protein [Chloroflexota bacterium]
MLRYEDQIAPSAPILTRIDSEADLEATLADAMLATTLNDLVTPQLAVRAENRTWTVPLLEDSLSIGRLPDNDLVLKLPRVSRHHARIERRQDTFLCAIWTAQMVHSCMANLSKHMACGTVMRSI